MLLTTQAIPSYVCIFFNMKSSFCGLLLLKLEQSFINKTENQLYNMRKPAVSMLIMLGGDVRHGHN